MDPPSGHTHRGAMFWQGLLLTSEGEYSSKLAKVTKLWGRGDRIFALWKAHRRAEEGPEGTMGTIPRGEPPPSHSACFGFPRTARSTTLCQKALLNTLGPARHYRTVVGIWGLSREILMGAREGEKNAQLSCRRSRCDSIRALGKDTKEPTSCISTTSENRYQADG